MRRVAPNEPTGEHRGRQTRANTSSERALPGPSIAGAKDAHLVKRGVIANAPLLSIKLMSANFGRPIVQVLRVLRREEQRTLRSTELEEQVVVQVKVQAVLHKGSTDPQIRHSQVLRRQRAA
eukprot:scaffold18380_cov30-Tisochrysis_lutea.AAC.2